MEHAVSHKSQPFLICPLYFAHTMGWYLMAAVQCSEVASGCSLVVAFGGLKGSVPSAGEEAVATRRASLAGSCLEVTASKGRSQACPYSESTDVVCCGSSHRREMSSPGDERLCAFQQQVGGRLLVVSHRGDCLWWHMSRAELHILWGPIRPRGPCRARGIPPY